MTTSTDPILSLADALDALTKAAVLAGVDRVVARAEGECLAATIAEPARGAYVDWSAQTGRVASAEPFMDAASRGRRYRSAPTATMSGLQADNSPHAAAYAQALADVAFAAVALGEDNPRTVGNAATAAAAQLGTSAPPPSTLSTGLSSGLDQPRETVPGVGDAITRGLLDQLGSIQRRLAGLNADQLGLDRLDHRAGELDHRAGEPDHRAGDLDHRAGEPDQVQAAEPPATPEPATEPEPEPDPRTVEELLAELDELIGLANVKAEIHRQAAVLRVEGLRQEAGLTSPTITRHLIFNGNPGTGKTTVARLVAGIYRALGLLSKGQLVEVDRSELVAGYLGQTAMKTAEVVASAKGGVLFIDEAYALAGDQYGQEAVDTLVKEMEDNRDDLVVIVAGYPVPMEVFIAQNPGLASRFRTTIDFADYSDEELASIFEVMAKGAEYDVDSEVLTRVQDLLAMAERGPTFGNARHVRNLLEAAIGRHAWRLRDIEAPTLEQLRVLVADDLDPVPVAGDGPTEAVEWGSAPPAAEEDQE